MKEKIRKLTSLITYNFGLKLLALIVSCGLWFVVNNITDPVGKVKFYNIPVEIINEDHITNSGKVYEVLDGTNVVTVEATGKRSVLNYITRDNIKAVADMENLTIMNTVGIQVSSNRNNAELEFSSNIESVKLLIEDVKRIQMIINTSTTGEPADGYVVGSVSSSQNIVRLSGPESVINQIDHIEAVANIDGYSSDINTSVELKMYDSEQNEIKSTSVKMNISTINVSVTILATKEVPISFTLNDEPANGYIASGEIVCIPETVVVAGRKSVVDALTKLTVSDAALSLADATDDVTEIINIKKYIPTGLQFADSNFNGNVSVTVGIEPLAARDISIPAKNFAAGFGIAEKPGNFNAYINEFNNRYDAEFKVRIEGTRAAVNAVNEDEVIGVINMDEIFNTLDLEEWVAGNYVGEIIFDFKLPEGIKVRTVRPYSLTVVLEEIEEEIEGD